VRSPRKTHRLSEPHPAPAELQWEVRRLAFLRIDLLARQEDDDWHRERRQIDLCDEKVESFGGRIEGRSPRGIVASFGLDPVEDAPIRAALAAMAARKAMASPEHGAGSRIVAAVHVGAIGIGRGVDSRTEIDSEHFRAAGRILDGLLGRAAPDTIATSVDAARFLARRFALERRPSGTGNAPGFFVVEATREAVPPEFHGRPSRFVGRAGELAFLAQAVAQIKGGRGQVIGVMGEPGVGKSRLVYEFRQGLSGRRVTYLEGRCLSYGIAIPYLPILDILRGACGIVESDGSETIRLKLQASLRETGIEPDHALPYLLRLLGVKEGTESLAAVGGETIKSRTFGILRRMILGASRRHPIVLAVEDLHWVDKTSEEYLASLAEDLGAAAIMLLATYRPGYRSPWIEHSHASQIALRPLTQQDSLTIVQSVLQVDDVAAPLAEAILRKGEGNPFVLEELARSASEHGDRDPSRLELPDTIQGGPHVTDRSAPSGPPAASPDGRGAGT
jgi:hypothetical protein